MHLVCTKGFPWQRVPGLSLVVTSYGFCRDFSLQTAEKPTVNCPWVSAEGSAEEDNTAVLPHIPWHLGRVEKHGRAFHTQNTGGPTFDLSNFKIDYLFVWLILHIIQNKRSTAH